MAIKESHRCLDCRNRPCVAGCPVNVQIPEFIKLISEGDFEGAYKKIKRNQQPSGYLRKSLSAGVAV